MENFDIAKYLREHQLGSYGILNHYVDLKPVNENSDPTDDKLIISVKNPISIDKIASELKAAGIPFQKRVDGRQKGYVIFYVKDVADLSKAQKAIGMKLDEASDDETEIPYAGPDNKLTGNGEGDAFDQAETVSEDYDNITSDRIMDLGGRKIEQGIIMLMDDGFPAEDVMELCRMFIQDQYGAKSQGKQFEHAESVSEADSMIFDKGWQYDDDDFYGGDSRAEGLVNQLDLKKIAEAVEGIIEDLEADGYHPEEIQEFLIDKVKEAFRPYMK